MKKIILDCDPGHDDAVAIMLAAANDNIEILGITCVGGNATLENTKINALKICTLIGKIDIPIVKMMLNHLLILWLKLQKNVICYVNWKWDINPVNVM